MPLQKILPLYVYLSVYELSHLFFKANPSNDVSTAKQDTAALNDLNGTSTWQKDVSNTRKQKPSQNKKKFPTNTKNKKGMKCEYQPSHQCFTQRNELKNLNNKIL